MEETRLIQRAASGDDAAFEQLVRRYEGKVYSMAYRMTNSHEDAADLSQEAFIRVWKSLSGFKGDAKFTTWLFRIVSNLCADYGRKRSRGAEIPTDIEETVLSSLPDTRFEPESTLERSELGKSIQQAVDALTPEHREIFIMREVYGLTYTQIAETLEVEEGTVKSRLFRARENLRETLSEGGNIRYNTPSKTVKGGDGL